MNDLMTLTLKWCAENQGTLWFALALLLSEYLGQNKGTQYNNIIQLVIGFAKKMALRKGVTGLLLLLCLGCTTLNVSMNTTSGNDNKPGIRTDADAKQAITPNTTATIPLK